MRKYHDLSSGNASLSKRLGGLSKDKSSNDSSYNLDYYGMFDDGYYEGINNIVKQYGRDKHHIENLPPNLMKNTKMAFLSEMVNATGEFYDTEDLNILELVSWVIGGSITKSEMADKVMSWSNEHISGHVNRCIDDYYDDIYGDDCENDYCDDHSVSDFI